MLVDDERVPHLPARLPIHAHVYLHAPGTHARSGGSFSIGDLLGLIPGIPDAVTSVFDKVRAMKESVSEGREQGRKRPPCMRATHTSLPQQ